MHCRKLPAIVLLAAFGTLAAASSALAQGSRCAEEAATIRHAEEQLPRLEVAPPGDRQIVCITMETNIVFARRVAAHLKQCPRSPYARDAETWQRTNSEYTTRFNERGCKPAIRSYRG